MKQDLTFFQQTDRGMTLIEVLTALAVASLLMVSVTTLTHSFSKTADQTRAKAATTIEALQVRQIFRSIISHAVRAPKQSRDSGPVLKSDRLRLLTRSPLAALPPNLYWVDLTADVRGPEANLTLSLTPFDGAFETVTRSLSAQEVSFRFLDRNGWVDNWTKPASLPSLYEIAIGEAIYVAEAPMLTGGGLR